MREGFSKCKGREEERTLARQGFGLGKTAFLKIGETCTSLNTDGKEIVLERLTTQERGRSL